MKNTFLSILVSILLRGDSNREFLKMHFHNYHLCDLHLVGYNGMTETLMVFQMDCKVYDQTQCPLFHLSMIFVVTINYTLLY